MMKQKNTDMLRRMICGMLVSVLLICAGVTCYAADDANKKSDEKDNSKIEKIDKDTEFVLDDDVQAWIDAGGAIPSNAKYASLSGSGHLWEIDSPDLKDGKVMLSAGTESQYLAGLTLKEWLNTQRFYGEKLGEKNNRIKFKRPKSDKEI
jgi:hypothetical protein